MVRNFQTELENSIEWANGTQFDISIKAETGTGTLGVPEVATVKIHDTFALVFTEGHGYTFVEWRVYKKSDTSIQVTDCITFKDPTSSETKATVQKYDTDLLIMPYCVSKEYVRVSFTSNGGYVIPSDTKNYYLDDEFQITCSPNYGYDFINWEVLDNTTGNIVNDVIQIQKEDGIWFAKVLKIGCNVTIYAVCGLRPTVVMRSPEYSLTENKSVNERIRVMFDQPMSLDSIYYSKEEKAEVEKKGTLLPPIPVNGEDRYYGYTTSDGNIYWKNIVIEKISNQENLLSHYINPTFITDQILTIGAIDPPTGTEIYINISEKICNQNNISMLQGPKWTYYLAATGTTKDETAPTINSLGIKGVINGEEKTITEISNSTTYPNIKTIKDLNIATVSGSTFIQADSLKLEGSFKDETGGSGISEFLITVVPVCWKTKTCPDDKQKEFTKTYSIPITNLTTEASCNTIFELRGDDGISISLIDEKNSSFKVFFTLKDAAGNERVYGTTYCVVPCITDLKNYNAGQKPFWEW